MQNHRLLLLIVDRQLVMWSSLDIGESGICSSQLGNTIIWKGNVREHESLPYE